MGRPYRLTIDMSIRTARSYLEPNRLGWNLGVVGELAVYWRVCGCGQTTAVVTAVGVAESSWCIR